MADLNNMEIDFDKVIEDAGKPDPVRKAHGFHLSTGVVDDFKVSCERVDRANAKVLEVLMSRFTDFVNSKLGPQKKRK